jgi:RNA-directed DNA polymerase
MTFEQYKTSFSEKALSNGYSQENISKCINYAEKLLSKNLPIIYDISHFAGLVGYNSNYIERAIVFTNHFYRKFSIPKTNGESRRISEPLPSLKDIQLWILNHVLYKVDASKFAKAYVPGVTLKQNLVFHKGQPIVLTIDIKDFFASIDRNKIEALFKGFGYSTLVSDLLAKLCCLNDKLPQGAPTSPCLSNLIMNDFDDEIYTYCRDNKIRYTRYADDMTFSGRFDSNAIKLKVTNELDKLSLTINPQKVKTMTSGKRQFVTGVVVNEKLQVSIDERNKIRQSIYYIRKFGLQSHLQKIGSKKGNYLEHLLGKVLFILFINPEDKEFLDYKSYLNGQIKLQ